MNIIDSKELYDEIFKRISERAKQKKKPPYLYINELGFKSKQYYTIRKFVKGETLDNNMKYPLGEDNLKKLCSKLQIKFSKVMYLVSF